MRGINDALIGYYGVWSAQISSASIILDLQVSLEEQKDYNESLRLERRLAREYKRKMEELTPILEFFQELLRESDDDLWMLQSNVGDPPELPSIASFIKMLEDLSVNGSAVRAVRRHHQMCQEIDEAVREANERIRQAWTRKLPELLTPMMPPSYDAFVDAVPFSSEAFER